jgi:excisionase family DNA binding protein
MTEQLYSAEEAAQILGLQVRTVRNYVRDGRLAGVRIGKQYRIARADLEAFTGAAGADRAETEPAVAPASKQVVEVSSVVEVELIDADSADRITRTLAAAVGGRPDTAHPLRVEPIYDEERSRLKVIVVGAAADTVEVIRMVDALAGGRG